MGRRSRSRLASGRRLVTSGIGATTSRLHHRAAEALDDYRAAAGARTSGQAAPALVFILVF